MQVKSIAECAPMEHSAVLLTCIKLPHGLKTFVLSIFKWPLKTGFTVQVCILVNVSCFFVSRLQSEKEISGQPSECQEYNQRGTKV